MTLVINHLIWDLDKDICIIPISKTTALPGTFNLDTSYDDNFKDEFFLTYNREDRSLFKIPGEFLIIDDTIKIVKFIDQENKITHKYNRAGGYYKLTNKAIHGDSGSPLFDSEFRFRGLIFAADEENSYAIPKSDIILLLLRSIILN